MDELIKIVRAQLSGLDNPISESDLISLGLSLGSPLLLDALDLVDRHQGRYHKLLTCYITPDEPLLDAFTHHSHCLLAVSTLTPPSPHTLILVNSSTTSTKYNVHLSPFSPHLPLGYCPCPTFSLKLFTTGTDHPQPPTSVPICKHLLAATIATHLGLADQKEVTLNWLASWANNFRDNQG